LSVQNLGAAFAGTGLGSFAVFVPTWCFSQLADFWFFSWIGTPGIAPRWCATRKRAHHSSASLPEFARAAGIFVMGSGYTSPLRRIPDSPTLIEETNAWSLTRNTNLKTIDWRLTTADARIKLKRLYPQFQS